MIKLKKYRFRRFIHFAGLFIEKYRYGEKIIHRNVKNFHRTVSPPRAYKQLSSVSSHTVKNRRAGPKTFVCTRVANLGYFPLKKKTNLGILLKDELGIFRPRSKLSPQPSPSVDACRKQLTRYLPAKYSTAAHVRAI
jgi:hypothetical protein